MMVSPCFKCEKKDYAGGCSIGCKDRDSFNAERQAISESNSRNGAADDLLAYGKAKMLKKKKYRS